MSKAGKIFNDIKAGYSKESGLSEFKPVKRQEGMASFRREELLKKMIKQNGLTAQKDFLIKIWRSLFEGFNPDWLSENQKFDFSFSAKEKEEKSLRLSYNNYGEKENFKRKILDAFHAVEGGYDLAVLEKILKFMGKTDGKHQTTIGLEWLAGQKSPRFKIYFEELFHTYSEAERVKKIKNICRLIAVNYASLSLGPKPDIGAFSVDFLPDGTKNLKVYLLAKNLDRPTLYGIMSLPLLKKHRKYLGLFLGLLNRTKCFYYITKRFGEKGGLLSWKLYRIYEVNQIGDFKPFIREITDFLDKIRFKKNNLLYFIKMSEQNKFLPYPVIFSLDFSRDGIRADSYFSLK